jgi:hypothetical protein
MDHEAAIMTVRLSMCDGGGALYSVHATVKLYLYIRLSQTPDLMVYRQKDWKKCRPYTL